MTNRDRGPAEQGSRLCLQRHVDVAPDALSARIVTASPTLLVFAPTAVKWVSPLKADDYLEYRDDFLDALGLFQHGVALRDFWPSGGPQWDGLATVENARREMGVLLLEAKAHIEEMASDCGAKAPESVAKIDKALAATQRHLGISGRDWKRGYYQLANRLAFLYFLNVVVRVPTWLVLVNFVDDMTHRPTSLAEWQAHYGQAFNSMGLRPASPLIERIVTVFPGALVR
jgi:hypothetical protein